MNQVGGTGLLGDLGKPILNAGAAPNTDVSATTPDPAARDHIAVEMGELLDQPDVLQQRRAARTALLMFMLSLIGAPVAWVRLGLRVLPRSDTARQHVDFRK